MKYKFLVHAIIIIVLLASCRRVDSEKSNQVGEFQPTRTSSLEISETSLESPVEDSDVAYPEETVDEESAVTETPVADLEVAEDSPTTFVPAMDAGDQEGVLPSPSLFPISWDDREIFRAGLVPGEEAVLNILPGATIYHLSLDINDPTSISGQMEARFTNQEAEALNELVLHMFPEKLGGIMEVENVRVNGKSANIEHGDGILRVELDNPLDPGKQIVLDLEFVTNVPTTESTKYNILSYEADILALAHAYPMFAVYDVQGWHSEPSPPHGDETFADMSFYLVEVNAPKDQALVASGVEIDRAQTGDEQKVSFAGGPMRDFYLAASDRFDLVQQRYGPVLISSYAPSDSFEGAQLALQVAADSLDSFGARFGPYPYSELDIVSTPTSALGIEYPGIFANALRIYDLSEASANGIPNRALVESVTAHEVGHQWFYNLVGSDQLNEPWLDEALSQYATWLYYVDRYGEQNAQGFFSSFEDRWARAETPEMPIGLPADAYSGQDYGAIVYGRGPIFIRELAETIGQETFDDFMRSYTEAYRWQIASGQEFMNLAEQHCQCDLSALFAEEVFGN